MRSTQCSRCGSPGWFACAPGTAPDAVIYPHKRPEAAAPEPPDEDLVVLEARTWCRACWLQRMTAAAGTAHTTHATGAS